MLDRQKIEIVLSRRFPGAPRDQVAAAANAIMGLGDEWEELTDLQEEFGYHLAAQCNEACFLRREVEQGAEFRVLRRRSS